MLQSLHEKGYDDAVRGLRRACRASMRTVVLSDYAEADVTRMVREERPRLVIAVGDGEKIVVKKGQTVIYKRYGGTEVKEGDQEYLLVEAEDILAVVEK